MSFTTSWYNLLDNAEEVSDDATLFTLLSGKEFRVTDVQEHLDVIEFEDKDETRPLRRDQFETLFRRVTDTHDGFDLDRLPLDVEPYATVLSLCPRFELDDHERTLAETETPTGPPLVEAQPRKERVTSVDTSKVDDTLEITELSESAVYEIEESEYVRKAEVDEDEKETRLQGHKDQLAAADEDTKDLQEEIEELEDRIDDLTSFDSASSFHTKSGGES